MLYGASCQGGSGGRPGKRLDPAGAVKRMRIARMAQAAQFAANSAAGVLLINTPAQDSTGHQQFGEGAMKLRGCPELQ